jgi:hypothetical protein
MSTDRRIYHLSYGQHTPTELPAYLLTRDEAAAAAADVVRRGAAAAFGSFTVWALMLECVTYSRGVVEYDKNIESDDGAYIAAAITKALVTEMIDPNALAPTSELTQAEHGLLVRYTEQLAELLIPRQKSTPVARVVRYLSRHLAGAAALLNASPVWVVEIEPTPAPFDTMLTAIALLCEWRGLSHPPDAIGEALGMEKNYTTSFWHTYATARRWADCVTTATGAACTVTQTTYEDVMSDEQRRRRFAQGN